MSWREELPDDLQNEKEFEAYETVGDLARRTLDLRKKLSRAIVVPGENADDEAREKFGGKIREMGFDIADPVPDEEGSYANGEDLRPIEGEAGDNWLRAQEEMLRKAGIGQERGRRLLEEMGGSLKDSINKFHEADKATGTALEEKFGKQLDDAISAAQRGAAALGLNDLMNEPLMRADGSMVSISHNEGLVDMLANYGKSLGEDGTTPPNSNEGNASVESVAELEIAHRDAMSEWLKAEDGDPAKVNMDSKLKEISWKLSHAKKGIPAPPFPGSEAIGKAILKGG